ncbi:MAG: hypothetical protein WC768_00165 [Patescibacteria group bacterium]|jgi:hypothetical protein
MRKMKTIFLVLGLLMIAVCPPIPASALGLNLYENLRIGEHVSTDVNIDVKAEMIGAKESTINEATSEAIEVVSGTGTLIEIGNTTAQNTTIIIRTTNSDGVTKDNTFEIDSSTRITTNGGAQASLSDWIAGDPITFTARHFINSDELVAIRLGNNAFKPGHKGINGWITAIHTDTNKVDVLWGTDTLTLNLTNANMVAGTKNPASITDLQVGDRIRARVTDNNDGNRLTWNASILVVLRRGNDLFMRVTRWVVPATITMIPQDLAVPITIEATVADSKFYQKNDVNNLIGAPGTKIMIDITSDTMLVRRYYGKALLNELSEGDSIRIIGRRDEVTGHLVARVIKDDSIQRLGVAHRLGSVMAIDSTAKTLTVVLFKTDNTDKTWTISTNDSTTIYVDGKLGSWSNIAIGSTVRIRGTANNNEKTIAADTIVVLSGLSSI